MAATDSPEQKARAEREALVAACGGAVVICAADGQVEWMSAAAEQLIPLDAEERKLPIAERLLRLHAEDASGRPFAPEASPLQRALRGEKVGGVLMRLRRGERLVWLLVRVAPVRTASGEAGGAVAVLEDASPVSMLQEEQQKLMLALTHDLRTPLAALMLQAQVLKARPNEPAEVVRRAEAILRTGEQVSQMVRELGELTRLDGCRAELRLEPVDLDSFLVALCGRRAGLLDLRRVDLRIAAELPPLRADRAQLERIVVHLLRDALRRSPSAAVVVEAVREEDGGVEMRIIDSGQGVPAAELARLFDRGQRAQSGQAQDLAGFGLLIAATLVRALGGRITAESAGSEGRTLRVVLPSHG